MTSRCYYALCAGMKIDYLQIGVATTDITPPVGVTLSGYGSRAGQAEGVDHALRAEAMVCRDGMGGCWAMVTSDVIGYPAQFVDMVRKQVALSCDVPEQAVLLSATHTHSGPAGQRTYGEQRVPEDDSYREWLIHRLADVVVEARDAVEPGAFEVTHTRAPLLGHNRRVIEGGTCRNEWEDLAGQHVGYFDPTVQLVGVRRPNGRLEALVVNYGCHPVTLGPSNMQISADYPGYLKDKLEGDGHAATVMFALGAAANINPRAAIRTGTQTPTAMGSELAAIVARAVPDLQPLSADTVRWVTEPWNTGTTVSEIQALRVGELVVLAIPGELFSEYAEGFRRQSPATTTLVVTMANDAVGYLPLDESYAQGGLEVMRAACDAVEAPLTEHVHSALARLG